MNFPVFGLILLLLVRREISFCVLFARSGPPMSLLTR